MANPMSPVVLLGCGRLGSAVVEGWLTHGGLAPEALIVLTPSPKPAAEDARRRGARVNPSVDALSEASALILAVKPKVWREAAAPLADRLGADTAVISLMAGVRSVDLAGVFRDRPLARLMPTTAVAQGQGVAALWSEDGRAKDLAAALFEPLADVVQLPDEAMIDPATAVAGSAPAFLYAFAQALAAAGAREGLPRDAAERLARGALRSAGAGAGTHEALEGLIARIASPGGTTEAGLKASGDALEGAAQAAVAAAAARARDLSGS